jgi:hypothetical protein
MKQRKRTGAGVALVADAFGTTTPASLGQVLVADANNDLVPMALPSGLAHVTGDVSTASGVPVQLLAVDAGAALQLSLYAPIDGFLLIDFAVSPSNLSKASILFQLKLDGVLIPNSDRAVKIPSAADADPHPIAITSRVAVTAGARVVTVEWCTNGGTALILRATAPGYQGASLRAAFSPA